MSLDSATEYLKQFGVEDRIQVFDVSSATVDLAAQAVGVEGARIAKTLSFKGKEHPMLVVAAGDARVDNKKFKSEFGLGVCPFAVKEDVEIFIDSSVKRFPSVYPAVGSANSAIELTPEELFEISHALRWVDVCKIPEE